MFEFVESFLLRVSPAGIIASRFVEVVPGLDTTIVYIVDDEGTPPIALFTCLNLFWQAWE